MYTAPRRNSLRPMLARVVVFCDDRVTAARYLEELRKITKHAVTLEVRTQECGGKSADVVVTQAIKCCPRRQGSAASNDSVWAVIDTESRPEDINLAMDAQERGAARGVRVVCSKPCFEVWTLLHFKATGQMFENCDAVWSAVKSAWESKFGQDPGKKTRADYSNIVPLRRIAVNNAKRHTSQNSQSWSEVYLLIEEIERFLALPGASPAK